MVTKKDIENMQEALKSAIMREDWVVCDFLVKKIGEASEQLHQRTFGTDTSANATRKLAKIDYIKLAEKYIELNRTLHFNPKAALYDFAKWLNEYN